MQLCLRNIGPIDTIDIDVDSDLTFIYGKNNIGKSYAITLLYLVLKNFAFELRYISRFPSEYFLNTIFDDNTALKNISPKLENLSELDITDDVTSFFSNSISTAVLPEFENSLRNSFGDIRNLNNKISKDPLEIIIKFEEYNIRITEKKNKLIAEYEGKGERYICRKIQRHWRPRLEGNNTIIYYHTEEQFIDDVQIYFYNLLRKGIVSILSKINNVYYLPASRSGLYRALNAFSQILAELAKKRNFLREKIVLPNISEQDSDYFSTINEINLKRIDQKFGVIAENIEKQLLKGKVSFNQATKQILFHPDNVDINLELLGTSSMIAEVSPIVLYLRHILSSGEDNKKSKDKDSKPILFIEEPEAHLHPEAQIVLMECFADLVKMGAKLVIASHSNYMFQKLNNLIAKKKINREVINGIFFIQGEKGSCSKTIPMSELGMEDDNFVEVAEVLYNEKLEIIEQLNAENASED